MTGIFILVFFLGMLVGGMTMGAIWIWKDADNIRLRAELATLRDNSAHFAEALIAESQKVVALRAELDEANKKIEQMERQLTGRYPEGKEE